MTRHRIITRYLNCRKRFVVSGMRQPQCQARAICDLLPSLLTHGLRDRSCDSLGTSPDGPCGLPPSRNLESTDCLQAVTPTGACFRGLRNHSPKHQWLSQTVLPSRFRQLWYQPAARVFLPRNACPMRSALKSLGFSAEGHSWAPKIARSLFQGASGGLTGCDPRGSRRRLFTSPRVSGKVAAR